MIDAKQIKQNLSDENILSILSYLGSEWHEIKSDHIEFESICHGSRSRGKLIYYKESQTLFCHRCSEQWDIFSFIQHIKNCSFTEALNLVIDICHLDIKKYNEPKSNIDDWQSSLLPLVQNKTPQTLQIYDKNVMRLFDNLYWDKWVQEGISIESMQKFNIKWYQRCQSVVLPCYDLQGNLIGIRNRYTQAADCEKGKYRPLTTLNDVYKFNTGLSLWGLYQNQDAIKKYKEVILCEGEKSVLLADTWGIDNVVSLYGANFTTTQRDLLLSLGVEKVCIAIDRQYEKIDKLDDGFQWWCKKVKKIASMLDNYMQVCYIYDTQELLKPKDSPMDKGEEVWRKLYESKRKWN